MEIIIVVIFCIGYLLIACEHAIRINKTATALITGVLCWTLAALAPEGNSVYLPLIQAELNHHLSDIAGILFFLIGAMTIVELIDAHDGFHLITQLVQTRNVRWLLWIVCWVAFFLSAVLDNLTTSIVMVSLTRKLVHDKHTRMLFAGMIIIAANAGGAWSPIGDVTTTMLWIGGQITSTAIIKSIFLPSVMCLLLPLIFLSPRLKSTLDAATPSTPESHDKRNGSIMLMVGIGALVFVPVFKSVTHLPPYMGILLGLGVLWVVSEMLNPDMDEALRRKYSASAALSRIDAPSVLFFFGILLAVNLLESVHTLHHFSAWLEKAVGDQRLIISLVGVLSAIVDNVPLVAASMGMYPLTSFPSDHMIWHYLAYCAGTGGSLLIIGSAAGVAVMGMENIPFLWYLKRIGGLAFIGYAAGAITYLLLG